jgi:hypothetical protein
LAKVINTSLLHGQTFVEELKNRNQWVDFLKTSQDATFYHSLEWKEVIEKSFPYSAVYLVVKDIGGDLLGICPGFLIKNGLLKIYVSLPHSDFGGPILDRNHLQRAFFAITNFVRKSCYDRSVAIAKFRFSNDKIARYYRKPLNYVDRSDGIMEIDLKATPMHFIWNEVLDRGRRKKIRRFETDGFQVREAYRKSDLASFYVSYLKNMKSIGVQEYPYTFFQNIWNTLHPNHFNILLVEKEKTFGGIAFFKYRQKIYLNYLGLNRELISPRYSLGLYLHWECIKWASANGFRYVCLGSTPSDTRNTYYYQKTAFGSSFGQQEMVSYPITYKGRIFLQSWPIAIACGRTLKAFLPDSLRDLAENRLSLF